MWPTQILVCAVALAPAAAYAVDAKSQAGALYEEGVALFKAKQFAAARAKFQAAYNLDPAQNLLYNLARAAEEMGDAEAAIGHYRAYVGRFPTADDRAEVDRRIRVLAAVLKSTKIGTLTVANLPAKAALKIDGEPAPATTPPGQWKLEVGEHRLEIVEPGKPPVARTVQVKEAQTTAFDFAQATKAPSKPAKPVVKAVVEPPPPPPEVGFWNVKTITGVSLVGAGAVLLGVGGYYFAQAAGNADDYNGAEGTSPDALAARQQAKDDFESNGAISTWTLVSGGVLLAGGVGLLAADYLQNDGWALVPTARGVGLVGTF